MDYSWRDHLALCAFGRQPGPLKRNSFLAWEYRPLLAHGFLCPGLLCLALIGGGNPNYWLVGDLTGLYTSSYINGMISIKNAHGLVLLFVDYECSGIIETIAYLSLLWFYPMYNRAQKVKLTFTGAGWILLANVFRLSLIASILYYAGSGAFFLVHSVLGRIIFYVLVIILYYNVFTRVQFDEAGSRFNYGRK